MLHVDSATKQMHIARVTCNMYTYTIGFTLQVR
jgi:hypothetical protein